MYWICTTLNPYGQETVTCMAGRKKDVLNQISAEQNHIIEIKPDYKSYLRNIYRRKELSTLMMAGLFKDFNNMLEVGMSVPQALLILQETSQDEMMRQMLSNIQISLQQGQSLTETFINTKSFPWIVSVSLSAGERTGKLSQTIDTLGKYFQQSYQVQSKIRQALVYPLIVILVLVSLMLFMSLKVVPQLKNLLPDNALHNPTTQCLLIFSFLIQHYFWFLVLGFVFFIAGVIYLRKSKLIDLENCLYRLPVIGGIIKESSLALYLLNLSVLLKSGVPLLKSIHDLSHLNQTVVAKHFSKVGNYLLGGSSFWQAIAEDQFFPRVIPATFRRAEEMAKIDEYSFSLSEFFQKRINAKIDALMDIIQPILLIVGGLFLVLIAVGFLLPIYGSLSAVAGG